MIIKSMSRRSGSAQSQFDQLLTYINTPEKTRQSQESNRSAFAGLLGYFRKEDAGQAILHNLRSTKDDLRAIEQEFAANAGYLPRRKNGVVLFHEVLSFHARDSEQLTPEILADIVKHYLQLRAPKALAYAKPHYDADHVHVHVAISANNLGSRQRLRLSRYEFGRIKQRMEHYQCQHYPQLVHSRIDHGEKQQNRQPTAEQVQQRHSAKADMQTEKVQAKQIILRALTEQSSQEAFEQALKQQGFVFYQRGTKTFGVEAQTSGRKYRFKTLGIMEEYEQTCQRWQELPDRLEQLNDTITEKQRQTWRSQGFVERIQAVLGFVNRTHQSLRQRMATFWQRRLLRAERDQ